MYRNQKKECGSIVTEAAFVLPVFFILFMLIINFVNIFCLHNMIQFAINSAAHELASYSYISSALSLHQTVNEVSADGDKYTERIDNTSNDILECLGSIQALKGDAKTTGNMLANPEISEEYINGITDQGEQIKEDINDVKDKSQVVIDDAKDIIEHPKETLIGAGYIGYDAMVYLARSGIGTQAVSLLTKKYLDTAYIQAHGVKGGLDFSDSSVFNDDKQQMVDIVVKYDIDLSAFGLVLGKGNPKLSMVQRVTVPAWLDGAGLDLPSK